MSRDPEPVSVAAPPLEGRVVAGQDWRTATFLHWRVDSSRVAPLLPAGIRPDEFDGSSWVGLIAFRLERARIAPFPPVPFFGDFTEVNVRLYGVDPDGRRGVVFRSLEAARLPAVLAARAAYSIPYRWARTALDERDGVVHYRSDRILTRARFRLAARPDRSAVVDDPLSAFLTARWALFTRHRGRTVRMPNAHEPWLLHPAAVEHLADDLVARAGLPGVVERAPDSMLFSPGVSADFAAPRPVAP